MYIYMNFTAEAYQRLIDGVNAIAEKVSFARHERFGFLTVCPGNIGASLHASVGLKLSNERRLAEICEKYSISHSRCEDTGVVTIFNRSAFGCTEYECIKRVWDGVAEMISEQLIPLSHVDDDAPSETVNNEEAEGSEAKATDDGAHKIDDASFVINRDDNAAADDVGDENAEENDKEQVEDTTSEVKEDDEPIASTTHDDNAAEPAVEEE